MDNYIMFEGKKIPLTDEQIAMLKSEKKNPFERCEKHSYYFHIGECGELEHYVDNNDSRDKRLFEVANYCTDEELLKQRALHETLNRLLWRFSMENGEGERPWNVGNAHWTICYSHGGGGFYIDFNTMLQYGVVYFPSKEIADRAIDEIIKPFMKEHPEFVW